MNDVTDVYRPPAIVLGLHGTGLRPVRCLVDECVEVHAVTFSPAESGRFTRQATVIRRYDLSYDDDGVIDWLIEYAKQLGGQPIVFPVCDRHAMALARNRSKLKSICRFWTTPYETLNRIISKDGLYQIAANVGVPVPPGIVEPDLTQLSKWCASNSPPYFVKPYFQGISTTVLKTKNRIFQDYKSLAKFIEESGSEALIVQRKLFGGDGRIYDCYGLCDRNGHAVTFSSHRRIRQLPADLGTTCFGEIPASPELVSEQLLFKLTAQLLNGLGYHGIFGIEWLQERETNKLYSLDFNARPFSTINHLKDCGINLPFLAYRELLGEDISATPLFPVLRYKTWMEFNRDFTSYWENRGSRGPSWYSWIRDCLFCRSHAFWSFRDPGPGLHELALFVRTRIGKIAKALIPSFMINRLSKLSVRKGE